MSYSHKASGLRKYQIIEVARRIIASKGMEELTVREVARGVGVSEGDIYRHFKSKRDILFLLMDDVELTLLNAIKETASTERTPLYNLEEVLKAHISYSEQRRGVSFIVIAEAMRLEDEDLRRRTLEVVSKYLSNIRDILAEGIKMGEIRSDIDLDAAALMFFAIVQSVVTMWSLSGQAFDMSERAMPLWEEYRRGIVARGTTTLIK